ncbi:DUF2510 domain-containing protein [Subtercola sp. PAMC28395]|uniref:DUF2510 domain-containing protein n=1 Tax=Subtercola sp. PAMC28395 TaxID=2846775 RepID=UPI001C0D9DCB|nr:DUF2510 domain-containing protein [Subtercola sp. PAMC28395]QWT23583.1 DUF2510 domain-containing protein [Subtercola sp. PAMC28395]
MTIPSQSVDSSAPQVKPGWYEDPEGTGQDRWWDGFLWTDRFHKAPRKSMYGSGYARSMRPGLNRPARIALVASTTSGLSFFVFFLVVAVFGNQLSHTARVGMLGFLVLSFGLGCTAVIHGSIGAARSARLGGLGACIRAICGGGVTLLVSGFLVASALVALMHA